MGSLPFLVKPQILWLVKNSKSVEYVISSLQQKGRAIADPALGLFVCQRMSVCAALYCSFLLTRDNSIFLEFIGIVGDGAYEFAVVCGVA